MSRIAEYSRIFLASGDDDWVAKRHQAVCDLVTYLDGLDLGLLEDFCATVSRAFTLSSPDLGRFSPVVQESIRAHAPSFICAEDQGELQLLVVAAAAIQMFWSNDSEAQSPRSCLMAASFWSALSYQPAVRQEKVEKVRRDVLEAARTMVLRAALSGRRRLVVPSVGPVNIDQESSAGSKVNHAFSRAVEPMLSALRKNAELDREELDFLWWLTADYSEVADIPLASLDPAVRAVVSGIEASSRLAYFPAPAHRHIVLRNVPDGSALSLSQLVATLAQDVPKLQDTLHTSSARPVLCPLLSSIAAGAVADDVRDDELTAREWGERALLEGSLVRLFGALRLT